jgi:peptidoglycan hydrolase-like protein with peptidoglycan-binding domain
MFAVRRVLLTGWSFGLLCGAAIVGNAIFMQAGKHPAPLFATREPSFAGQLMPDPALVSEIQQALAARKIYRGAVDGIAGPETRLAIRIFERNWGLPTRGEPSAALLATLATSPDVAVAKTARAEPDPVEAPDPRLAEVQGALSRAAYGPLNVDGLPGPQTRDAIMRFQLDEGLPVTGKLDDALVKKLKAVGALGA